jgi:Sel1 repeat
MKRNRVATALLVTSLLAVPAPAQSIGRIKRSLDRAVGGGQQPPAQSPRPGAAPAPVAAPPLSPAGAAAKKKKEEQDAAEADKRVVEFLRERIKDGSPSAAFDLGKRYEEGRGVPADPAEARKLMELAAQRDNSDARQWLKDNPASKDEAAKK